MFVRPLPSTHSQCIKHLNSAYCLEYIVMVPSLPPPSTPFLRQYSVPSHPSHPSLCRIVLCVSGIERERENKDEGEDEKKDEDLDKEDEEGRCLTSRLNYVPSSSWGWTQYEWD